MGATVAAGQWRRQRGSGGDSDSVTVGQWQQRGQALRSLKGDNWVLGRGD